MSTHEGHDHPATKAARAACRRSAGLIGEGRKSANDLPKMSASEKARVKAGKPKASQTRHKFELNTNAVPGTPAARQCRCGKAEKASIHDPVDHDDQRRDGRRGESRLATARAACKHPAGDWVLKGSTRKRTGTWYCKCGQRMGDEGPKDLAARIAF